MKPVVDIPKREIREDMIGTFEEGGGNSDYLNQLVISYPFTMFLVADGGIETVEEQEEKGE